MKSFVFAAVLVSASACEPIQEPLGPMLWTVDTDVKLETNLIGAGGHVAWEREDGTSVLYGPNGALLWSRDTQSALSAVDSKGAGYFIDLSGDSSDTRAELLKLSATDGEVVWLRQVGKWGAHVVVVDAFDNVWYLVETNVPIDFGGGPVGNDRLSTRWARYSSDGTYLASGAIDMGVGWSGVALPGGGIVVTDRWKGAPTAIDETGHVLWQIDEKSDFTLSPSFAITPDGELTVVTHASGSSRQTVIRFDAQQVERWRRDVDGIGVTGLSNGGVILSGWQSLGRDGGAAVAVLEYLDAAGETRREIFPDGASIFYGPATDRYAIAVSAPDGEQEADVHSDVVAAHSGGALVMRGLP